MGKKAKVIFDILFFIYLFLVMISIIIAVSKTTFQNYGVSIMSYFDKKVTPENKEEMFKLFNFYSCYIIGFIFFFLVIQKSIEKFRYFSFFSFLIVTYIILVIVCEFPMYYNDLKER